MPFSLKNLLAPDKEQELLQSFVRVEIGSEQPDQEHASKHKQNLSEKNEKARKKSLSFLERDKSVGKKDTRKKSEPELVRRRRSREMFNDYYTDKDRAAAVSAGYYDIKQSLQLKKQQDRNEVLLIADEADISSLISLGLKEIKNGNTENAILCFTKALELNKTDVNALVARSKCYLLLGEASKALQDAEMALGEEAGNMRAMYQKAESLYYLGQFEQSLMFFHRALRARPELASIRLGVQKTQEAIQNTIGMTKPHKTLKKSIDNTPRPKMNSINPRTKPKSNDTDKRIGSKLLGELRVDKEYLQNLLKHPDLKEGNKLSENVANFASEAVSFLNKREEFWRQQRPCSVLLTQKNIPQDDVPFWF